MPGASSSKNAESAVSTSLRLLPSRTNLRSAHTTDAAGAATMGADTGFLAAGGPTTAGQSSFPTPASHGVDAYGMCADLDAQATVTDFLDFTEYLPSDIARSLTLIGKLDQTYVDASTQVHELTSLWGQLPSQPPATRPAPAAVRADISAQLGRGLSARAYAHAESLRMAENVKRHYHRAQLILAKLQTMLENYPEAEQQQQEQMQQKQQREQEQQQQQQDEQQEQQRKLLQKQGKPIKEPGIKKQARMQHQRVPRITVPGEVLPPYELDFDAYSGDSDVSSLSSDDGSPAPAHYRRTGGGAGRGGGSRRALGGPSRMKTIKAATTAGMALPGGVGAGAVMGQAFGFPLAGAAAAAGSSLMPRTPKVRMQRGPRVPGPGRPANFISTSKALARLRPPPENAVIGSADAPWLQLTPYELAKLRKRMKKNATWTPSETMIARELKLLGRNLEAYRTARQKAEDEGRPFDAAPSAGNITANPAVAATTTTNTTPTDDDATKRQNSNQWAQLAAQEAEESARRLAETARALLYPFPAPAATAIVAGGDSTGAGVQTTTSRKRKRDTRPRSESADLAEGGVVVGSVEVAVGGSGSSGGTAVASQRPLTKRVKTETPVPIPQPTGSGGSAPGSAPPPSRESSGLAAPAAHQASRMRHSTTPAPAPAPTPMHGGEDQAQPEAMVSTSGNPSHANGGAVPMTITATTTTTIPLKPPSASGASTSIHVPVRELRTRDVVRKEQQAQQQQQQQPQRDNAEKKKDGNTRRASVSAVSRPSSRAGTPASTVVAASAEGQQWHRRRRSSSRGGGVVAMVVAAAGGGATPSLASERPRRASTAFHGTADGGAVDALTSAGPPPTAAATARPTSRRGKRPAPGIVSRTSSGGNAAVGRRKAAPRKKRGSNVSAAATTQQHQQQQQRRQSEGAGGSGGDDDVEVDDEGQVIDPDEPRYCVCNRVSFGTMIQCDNVDEWFHLECVGLTAVPARTTKWYCPDCRVLLNIGEKGEVNARGIRK